MATGKHLTLANELEAQIMSGRYGWEGGLPAVSEVAKQWNMTVNTAKEAYARLEGKGLIEKRGISYYVKRIPTVMTRYVTPIHIRLPHLGYYKNIGNVGIKALPQHLAEKLQVLGGAQVVCRSQISGDRDTQPVQLSTRYHFISLSSEDIERMKAPLYEPLWDNPEYATDLLSYDEVAVRMATLNERDLLKLPENSPVFALFEVIRSTSGILLMAQEIVLSQRETLIFEFPFTNRPSTQS